MGKRLDTGNEFHPLGGGISVDFPDLFPRISAAQISEIRFAFQAEDIFGIKLQPVISYFARQSINFFTSAGFITAFLEQSSIATKCLYCFIVKPFLFSIGIFRQNAAETSGKYPSENGFFSFPQNRRNNRYACFVCSLTIYWLTFIALAEFENASTKYRVMFCGRVIAPPMMICSMPISKIV